MNLGSLTSTYSNNNVNLSFDKNDDATTLTAFLRIVLPLIYQVTIFENYFSDLVVN